MPDAFIGKLVFSNVCICYSFETEEPKVIENKQINVVYKAEQPCGKRLKYHSQCVITLPSTVK